MIGMSSDSGFGVTLMPSDFSQPGSGFAHDVTSQYNRPAPNPAPYTGNEFGRSLGDVLNMGQPTYPQAQYPQQQYGGYYPQEKYQQEQYPQQQYGGYYPQPGYGNNFYDRGNSGY